ncbi:MAG TPA: hypothetical protein VFS21_38395 [Roseiflexaceae bacterium]|nr:hypothetical protein [Roseiflexaceae bacterium]
MSERKPHLGHTALALRAIEQQLEAHKLDRRESDRAFTQQLEQLRAAVLQVGELVISMAVEVESARLDLAQLIEGYRRQNDELADLRRMLGATGPAPHRSSEPPAEEAA